MENTKEIYVEKNGKTRKTSHIIKIIRNSKAIDLFSTLQVSILKFMRHEEIIYKYTIYFLISNILKLL